MCAYHAPHRFLHRGSQLCGDLDRYSLPGAGVEVGIRRSAGGVLPEERRQERIRGDEPAQVI